MKSVASARPGVPAPRIGHGDVSSRRGSGPNSPVPNRCRERSGNGLRIGAGEGNRTLVVSLGIDRFFSEINGPVVTSARWRPIEACRGWRGLATGTNADPGHPFVVICARDPPAEGSGSSSCGLTLLATFPAKVAEVNDSGVRITDGDTLKILTPANEQIKIWLAGITAPEHDQPNGSRTKQALSDPLRHFYASVLSPTGKPLGPYASQPF